MEPTHEQGSPAKVFEILHVAEIRDRLHAVIIVSRSQIEPT